MKNGWKKLKQLFSKEKLTNRAMEKRFLNVNEVAEYLGVEASTIYAWVHTRQIPFYKVGRLVKFKQDQIDRWIENKKVAEVSLA